MQDVQVIKEHFTVMNMGRRSRCFRNKQISSFKAKSIEFGEEHLL